MNDYIKREDVIAAFEKRCMFYRGKGFLVADFDKLFVEDKIVISKIPSADVRGNVHAEWTNEYDGVSPWTYRCSNCGNRIFSFEYEERPVQYCGKCGADMRGENIGQG